MAWPFYVALIHHFSSLSDLHEKTLMLITAMLEQGLPRQILLTARC